MDGSTLYRLVEAYERLGVHRAGTGVDRATVDWLEARLRSVGFRTSRTPVPFDRYLVDSKLTADGATIDHLPLAYEWCGSVETTDVAVFDVDIGHGGHTDAVDDAAREASASGSTAAVLATRHPDGSLVAANRTIGDRGGIPTVLVAGRDHDRLRAARSVRLRMHARRQPATTENLTARNDVDGIPLLLTTPLTRWFRCSGERGTGIAVLLDLVERFADHPLLVLATGGHELDYLGVRRWVADDPPPVAAIAHIGASVACDASDRTGRRRLVTTRIARTDVGGPTADAMGAALATAAYRFEASTASWGGESEVLCELGAPMLSVTGAGAAFHTPEDVTADVTSPASLALASAALGDAVQALHSSIVAEGEEGSVHLGQQSGVDVVDESAHVIGVDDEG